MEDLTLLFQVQSWPDLFNLVVSHSPHSAFTMAVLAETIAKNIAEGLTSFLGVFSGRLKVSDRCKVVVLKGAA